MPKKGKNGADTSASIMVVLDRSGSMGSVQDATIAGFNQFRDEQAALPGAKFSMLQFDTVAIDDLYVDEPVENVKPLNRNTYQPRGGTPLYDAIGRGIKALEARKPQGKVIFCIVTDGEENSSTEYKREAIFDLVKEKRAEGWEFVFMGAGIDAYAASASLGVAAASTYGYAATPASTQAAFTGLSMRSSGYRSGTVADMSMPDVDVADPSYVPGGGSGTVQPGSAPRSSTWSSVRASKGAPPLPREVHPSTK